MKWDVLLKLRGTQSYPGQEPDVIELTTDGQLEQTENGWNLSYEESALTGMEGVMTTFRVDPGKVTLDRTGALRSTMIFEEGVPHDSLYQLDFGALLMRVCAKKVRFDITPEGGTVDLLYTVEIEQNEAGNVDYHLEINRK